MAQIEEGVIEAKTLSLWSYGCGVEVDVGCGGFVSNFDVDFQGFLRLRVKSAKSGESQPSLPTARSLHFTTNIPQNTITACRTHPETLNILEFNTFYICQSFYKTILPFEPTADGVRSQPSPPEPPSSMKVHFCLSYRSLQQTTGSYL